MSKHLSDGNKAKLLAFLQSRAAAGEQSLKTWGKQHKLLSHQAGHRPPLHPDHGREARARHHGPLPVEQDLGAEGGLT